MSKSPDWKIRAAIAFATVYLVWGSTYLAIRVGVQELPPALFAGARFVAAGLLLIGYAYFLGQTWPRSLREWKIITVVGVLLLIGGNGLVVWGSQWVPSNHAALIVATVALWIAALGTLGRYGQPLSRQAIAGLITGLVGVALLLRPSADISLDMIWGQVAILGATILWSTGTIYAKRQHPRTAPLMSAGLQSLVAGMLLCIFGWLLGEPAAWRWTFNGTVALSYLIVLGAAAYAAYVWLVHQVRPAALGTYAYINPAIAVVLGWWILDERLDSAQVVGMATILAGVVLTSTARVPAADTSIKP